MRTLLAGLALRQNCGDLAVGRSGLGPGPADCSGRGEGFCRYLKRRADPHRGARAGSDPPQARLCLGRGGRLAVGPQNRLSRCGLRAGHRGLAAGARQRRGLSRPVAQGAGLHVQQRLSRPHGQALDRRAANLHAGPAGRAAGDRRGRLRRRDDAVPLHAGRTGKHTGSTWTQTLVFPAGERFFISSDRIDSVNAGPPVLRIDMPGHIRHNQGDTFSEVYLSYLGDEPIAAGEFFADFRRTRNSITPATTKNCRSGSFGRITCAIRRRENRAPGWPA